MPGRVIVVMGSKSDLDHVGEITVQLQKLGIGYTLRVASAHKSARYLLDLLAEYRNESDPRVFITVAGRSNALGGMVDANIPWPVITCPPVSSTFGGADIYSSLRMPSGVAPLVILDPQGAALAAAKMLALSDPELRARVVAYQTELTEQIIAADKSVN